MRGSFSEEQSYDIQRRRCGSWTLRTPVFLCNTGHWSHRISVCVSSRSKRVPRVVARFLAVIYAPLFGESVVKCSDETYNLLLYCRIVEIFTDGTTNEIWRFRWLQFFKERISRDRVNLLDKSCKELERMYIVNIWESFRFLRLLRG